MAFILCRKRRREISLEEPFCPHCGVRMPADLSREENWASARERRSPPPDLNRPFRVLLAVLLILLSIAIGLAALRVAVDAMRRAGRHGSDNPIMR
jgi:hypothetical protein